MLKLEEPALNAILDKLWIDGGAQIDHDRTLRQLRASFFIFGGASLLWLLPWARCAVPHTRTKRMRQTTR